MFFYKNGWIKKQITGDLWEEGVLLGLKDEELAKYVRTEFKERERIEKEKGNKMKGLEQEHILAFKRFRDRESGI